MKENGEWEFFDFSSNKILANTFFSKFFETKLTDKRRSNFYRELKKMIGKRPSHKRVYHFNDVSSSGKVHVVKTSKRKRIETHE